MRQYRTTEQFETIIENMQNGNWQDAGKNCVVFGFYANDLVKYAESQDFDIELVKDLVLLVEIAQALRYKESTK